MKMEYGVVTGWPGTYWLRRTRNVQIVAGEDTKDVEKRIVLMQKACARECEHAYALMQEKREVRGLEGFLSNVIGMHRAAYYWLQQSKKK